MTERGAMGWGRAWETHRGLGLVCLMPLGLSGQVVCLS